MPLELTLNEARVLKVVVEYIVKHNAVSELIHVGDKGDIKTMAGVAGCLRALYEIEKGE